MQNNSRCGALIKQLNDTLEKNANNALREDNLTLSQVSMLVLLDENGDTGMSIRDIGDHLSIQQPTVTGIILRLKEKGYVLSRDAPDDKRLKIISLTDAGRAKAQVAHMQMSSTENALLRGMNANEREMFLQLLQKALSNISKV